MASAEENRIQRRRFMLEAPPIRVIPIVALPMVITMLVDSVYSIADTYFVSRIGISATAAVGINDSLLQLMRSIAMGFGIGAGSYISRLLGAKREEEANCVAMVALLTGIGVLSIMALLAALLIDPLVMLMGSTLTTKAYSIQYARIILCAAPFTAAEVVLSQLLRAEGSAKYSMLGMMSGCGLNVILDPIFISTLELGVAGAALATALAKILSVLVLSIPFLRKRTILELKLRNFRPSGKMYVEIGKIGIPSFFRSAMISVSGMVLNHIAGSFSDAALAAVNVANKSAKLVGAGIIGFGQGLLPIVGYCWGAGRYRRVREVFWTCSAMGAGIAIVLGLIMGIFAEGFISAFTVEKNPEILAIGLLMLRSQCVTMVIHVWSMIVNSLFQAAGRVLPAAILGLSRQGLCLIPMAFLLSALFGVNGLAVAQAGADVLMTLLCLPFLFPFFRELRERESAELTE